MTKSRPAEQKGSANGDPAATRLIRSDAGVAQKEKPPLAIINGHTPLEVQEEILSRPEVGLRAGIAISSRNSDVVKRLRSDPSELVRIALLDANPMLTATDIMEMGIEARRRGNDDVLEAAIRAMRRREPAELQEELQSQ